MYRIPIPSVSDRDKERLARCYRVDDNGCWVSTLSQNGNGYTQIKIAIDGERRAVLTHRASYVAFVGPIPDGLVLDHLCRNRACINPAHLEPVTQSENILRGELRVATAVACKHGHPFDDENTYYPPNRAGRQCRTCVRNNSRRYQQRRAALAGRSVA